MTTLRGVGYGSIDHMVEGPAGEPHAEHPNSLNSALQEEASRDLP